jgi:hypothetical protein
MTRHLFVTAHAVDRFVERHRPGSSKAAAREELEALLRANAIAPGDGVRVLETPAAERILIAIRADRVVTVYSKGEGEAAAAGGVLTITGGRWDGVRVQLRDGDGLNAVVGRLLAAMRAGPDRRSA